MLDLFPKIPTDLSQSTVLGGWFSTVTAVLMLLLFQVELFSFLSAPIESFVVVDNASETKVLRNKTFDDCTVLYCSGTTRCRESGPINVHKPSSSVLGAHVGFVAICRGDGLSPFRLHP